ncbi:helix-turn-helix domain-containing protein [Haloarchaeobius litoreus]|uniref:Helix-turn-helix domain-containing protein n=1 Tax=Haloarchaeobius litoreus TaxID=755306 RepID=A0ABD6DPU2_9EURY|nr:helix-turn-helix domain-containing protein [Haloarchaeobius litoreus]
MIRARFRMTLPREIWISEVSRANPQATYRLLTAAAVQGRSLELGEVVADDPRPAVGSVRDHPDVVAFDLLFVDDGRALSRYESTELRLYEFLGASSLPPLFPVVVEDGRMTFDVAATRDQFEAVGAVLDDSEFQYELLSVVHTDESDDVLTDRQRECLRIARQAGYFEVPRRCTLADVADRLDVDKSTASVTLRRATERVLDQFLVGPE